MTREQKKLVGSWVGAAALLIGFIIFWGWIMRYGSVVQPLLLVAGAILAVYYRSNPPSHEPTAGLVEIVRNRPILQTWLAVYGLIVAAVVTYVFVWNAHFLEGTGIGLLLLMLAPLVLPQVIIMEREKYRQLGAKGRL